MQQVVRLCPFKSHTAVACPFMQPRGRICFSLQNRSHSSVLQVFLSTRPQTRLDQLQTTFHFIALSAVPMMNRSREISCNIQYNIRIVMHGFGSGTRWHWLELLGSNKPDSYCVVFSLNHLTCFLFIFHLSLRGTS